METDGRKADVIRVVHPNRIMTKTEMMQDAAYQVAVQANQLGLDGKKIAGLKMLDVVGPWINYEVLYEDKD